MRNFNQTWQTNWNNKLNRYLPLLVVVAVFGGLGTTLLLTSHAATPVANLEAENGTVSSAASNVADTTASAGHAVKFGSSGTGGTVAKPSATNTGYPAGQTFTNYTGSNENNTSNVTYSGVNFGSPGSPGWYTFTGDNVTFKNCKIASDIWIEGDNVTIDHCDINGGISINNSNTVTMTYNNLHNWEDGLHITADPTVVKNITFSYNYMHNPTVTCDSHADGTQTIGVDGFLSNYNNIDLGPQPAGCGTDPLNSTFQINTDFNGVVNKNLTIDHNWLNGGGYIFRLYACGPVSKVTNNRFGRLWSFGPLDTPGSSCLADKSGNVYDDTDAPLTL